MDSDKLQVINLGVSLFAGWLWGLRGVKGLVVLMLFYGIFIACDMISKLKKEGANGRY